MLLIAGIFKGPLGIFENLFSFFKIVLYFIKKKNPALSFFQNILGCVNEIITAYPKLKYLRYNVSRMKYRVNQMEHLIQVNNPHNFSGGSNINQLR